MKLFITILYFICSFFAFGAGVDSEKNRYPSPGTIGWIILTFLMLVCFWGNWNG